MAGSLVVSEMAVMVTATAPAITREILVDRWQGVMKWERTFGNASPQYEALTDAIDPLLCLVAGVEMEATDGTLTEDLLDRIGDVIIDRITEEGIAR